MRRLAEHSDDQFRKDLAADYRISFKVSADSLTYCLLDILRNKVVCLATWQASRTADTSDAGKILDELFTEQPWLLGNYSHVELMCQGSPFTLVPEQVFDEARAGDFLRFMTGTDDEVLHTRIASQRAVAVYAPAPGLPQAMFRKFGGAGKRSYDVNLVTCLGERESDGSSLTAYLNIDEGQRFQVLVFKGRKLAFLNTFSYSGTADFIYFLLAALRSCGANPSEVNLKLSGSIDRSSALFEVTYRYIRNVSFVGRNNDMDYAGFFEEIPGHMYYNLLSSLL